MFPNGCSIRPGWISSCVPSEPPWVLLIWHPLACCKRRHAHVRVKSYAEQIAMLKGESHELHVLEGNDRRRHGHRRTRPRSPALEACCRCCCRRRHTAAAAATAAATAVATAATATAPRCHRNKPQTLMCVCVCPHRPPRRGCLKPAAPHIPILPPLARQHLLVGGRLALRPRHRVAHAPHQFAEGARHRAVAA